MIPCEHWPLQQLDVCWLHPSRVSASAGAASLLPALPSTFVPKAQHYHTASLETQKCIYIQILPSHERSIFSPRRLIGIKGYLRCSTASLEVRSFCNKFRNRKIQIQDTYRLPMKTRVQHQRCTTAFCGLQVENHSVPMKCIPYSSIRSPNDRINPKYLYHRSSAATRLTLLSTQYFHILLECFVLLAQHFQLLPQASVHNIHAISIS